MQRLSGIVVLIAALAVASGGSAGGVSDEACPNVAGEHTNTCPTGLTGTPYSLRFVESEGSGCGPGRQTFHLDSGALPPELTLAPDGTLSGTPTRAGVYRFYVEMREPSDDPANCAGKRTQKQFTIKICDRLGIVASIPGSPRSEVGVRFGMRLSSCAGVSPLAWAQSGGLLPPGVRLRTDGSVAGVPREAGAYRFTVVATDVRGPVGTYSGTIVVRARLRMRTQRLAAAMVGHPYRARLAAVGGAAPKRWAISRGRLPRGIRLDRASGLLTGTAATPGRYRVTITVRDALSVASTRTLVLVVRNPERNRRTPALGPRPEWARLP